MKKLFISLAIAVIFCTTLTAQRKYIGVTNSYGTIITDDTTYQYETDVNDFLQELKCTVSSDCKSIRVIWSSQSQLFIDEYLYSGNKKQGKEHIDDFVLKQYMPGETSFIYRIGGKLDNLHFGSNYYRFIATFQDGTVKMGTFDYYIHSGGFAEKGKPVIYLYPEKKQNIKVNVKPKGAFTVTIPEIGKGWNVTATPDGKIYDKKTKQEYPYLFWESVDTMGPIDMSEGFVVSKDNLVSFFKEKLAYQGLNEKEIADFLEYWEPKLNTKPYAFITFYSSALINSEAPLTISPKPDSVIRVYFDYKLLDEPVETKEQTLEKGERKGFTVTEWGGRLYK